MENNVAQCKDCPLCRLDLKKKVNIGGQAVEKVYCGHLVKLVSPDDPACYFINHRQ